MMHVPKQFRLGEDEIGKSSLAARSLPAGGIARLVDRSLEVDIDPQTAAWSTAAGSPEQFRYTAVEWLELAIEHCHLSDADAVLDIGCAAGRIAFGAAAFLGGAGTCVGFDPLDQQIAFCKKAITRSNFAFHHVDLWYRQYCAEGKIGRNAHVFPAGDGTMDVVVSASILTHLERETAIHHLRETACALRSGERAMYYLFALDADSTPAEGSVTRLLGKQLAWCPNQNEHFEWRFAHRGSGFYRHSDENGDPKNHYMADPLGDPMAYEIEAFEAMVTAAGLTVVEFLPGGWCRDTYVRSYQDIFLLEKP